MVLSILWLASVPTVGYGDNDVGPLKRGKLQEYVAEALAQAKGDLINREAGSLGPSFGSPVSSAPLPAELSSLRLPAPPTSGSPGTAQQAQGKQQRRRSRRHSSASKGEQQALGGEGSREISSPIAEVSSPTAITSPHASDGTASLFSGRTAAQTPDSAATSLDSAPGALSAAAAAAEQLPGPADRPASSGASTASEPKSGDDSRSSSSVGRLTPSASFHDGPQADRLLSGALTASEPGFDMRCLIQQLREPRLTGQVCAWGWEQAARISHRQRSMPTELFMALWAATEATAGRFFPQDVLALLEAWLTLLQTCPRHFRLRVPVVESLAVYSIPPVVKRMTERQLGQFASLCCQVALHRCENGYGLVSSGHGPSARDLMQPIFALVAAELAWRCANKMRYVSVETLGAVGRAATAWRWEVVRHRDSPQLAALKESTAEALVVLQGHLAQ